MYRKKSKEEIEMSVSAKKADMQDKVIRLAEEYKTDPEKLVDFLRFSSQFYTYSPKNVSLIYAQNKYASFTQSFADWKKSGFSVKAKEEGLNIFVPVTITYLETAENKWVQLSKASAEEKEAYINGKVKSMEKLKFKIGTTFDIAQTTFPKERYPELLNVGYESVRHASLFTGLKNFSEDVLKCPVQIVDLKSVTLRGQYSPKFNAIKINKNLNDSEKFSTLTHELGHAIAHKAIKIRDKSESKLEFEGDAISIMLHEKFGISCGESTQRHLSYHYNKYIKEIELKSNTLQPKSEKQPVDPGYLIGEAFGRVYTLFQLQQDKMDKYIEKEIKRVDKSHYKGIKTQSRPDKSKNTTKELEL